MILSYKLRKRLKILPSIIFGIIIFIISSIEFRFPPGTPGTPSPSYLLLLHAGEFGLFSMLLMYGFYPRIKIRYMCLTSILYGILDEIHQSFVPGRTPSFMDIGLDLIHQYSIIGWNLSCSTFHFFLMAGEQIRIFNIFT